MKTLVAFPSTAIFGQQAALAFLERGELEAFLTTFAFDPQGSLARSLSALPASLGQKLTRELSRRAISALPSSAVESLPLWEIVRTLADKAKLGRKPVDMIWDHLSRQFTAGVARRIGTGVSAVYAYEYTALEAFEAADRMGVAKVLDFPSLNSRQFQQLQREQKAAFPELAEPLDAYFESVFETRQARRDAEMRAADIIITNSSVTRRSHIVGGADPARTFAVPYGAPPVQDSGYRAMRSVDRPLKVIWAGTFSIRKGAHLFVDAWRQLNASGMAQADIYGAITLPDRMWRPAPEGMSFHGSVVHATLFAAYEEADVMIFPTLSDGFGMVVTEAFSKGLPVITTDQAGASDLVRHGENGLIIPSGEVNAIAEALRWCLDNRSALRAMSHAASDTARGWQWSDYRRELHRTVTSALQAAGKLPAAA